MNKRLFKGVLDILYEVYEVYTRVVDVKRVFEEYKSLLGVLNPNEFKVELEVESTYVLEEEDRRKTAEVVRGDCFVGLGHHCLYCAVASLYLHEGVCYIENDVYGYPEELVTRDGENLYYKVTGVKEVRRDGFACEYEPGQNLEVDPFPKVFRVRSTGHLISREDYNLIAHRPPREWSRGKLRWWKRKYPTFVGYYRLFHLVAERFGLGEWGVRVEHCLGELKELEEDPSLFSHLGPEDATFYCILDVKGLSEDEILERVRRGVRAVDEVHLNFVGWLIDYEDVGRVWSFCRFLGERP